MEFKEFNMQLGKLGFEIESEIWFGKKFYRWILTEDGIRVNMKSGIFYKKEDAETAAIDNIDYLCERFNYKGKKK